MAEIDYQAEITTLLQSGLVNSFMAHYLLSRRLQDWDEQMWNEALVDAEFASKLGVDTDEEFRLWFYLEHFLDDVIQRECGQCLSESEKASLKQYMFGRRNELGFTQLDDFHQAAREWLRDNKPQLKAAYKNVGLMYKTLPRYDLNHWSDLVQRINQSRRYGFKRRDAVLEAVSELELPERLDFLEWYNLHVDGEPGKYGVNDEIKSKSRNNLSGQYDRWAHAAREVGVEFTKVAEAMDERFYYLPKFRNEQPSELREVPTRYPSPMITDVVPAAATAKPTIEQAAVDFEAGRNKLMGRIFAIDKLLEKYKKVLNHEQLDGIEDSLNDLKKKVRRLKMASSIRDSLVKTANILEKYNFEAGVAELRSLAEAPVLPEDAHASLFGEKDKQEKLTAAVNKLHGISVILKNRDVVRAIAESDIMLNELNMASFFPELQDAQAKLIDAFHYASNKIEDILPKLRGSLGQEPEPDVITPVDRPEKAKTIEQLHELSKGLDKQPADKEQSAVPVKPGKPAEVAKPEVPEDEESDKLKELLLPVRQ